MASCNFHVGQKVVCVDGEFNGYFHDVSILPVEGCVYTIRSIELMTALTGEQSPIIRLVEVVNAIMPWEIGDAEIGFVPRRFRPVVERKTDISIFTAMLNKTPEQVAA